MALFILFMQPRSAKCSTLSTVQSRRFFASEYPSATNPPRESLSFFSPPVFLVIQYTYATGNCVCQSRRDNCISTLLTCHQQNISLSYFCHPAALYKFLPTQDDAHVFFLKPHQFSSELSFPTSEAV